MTIAAGENGVVTTVHGSLGRKEKTAVKIVNQTIDGTPGRITGVVTTVLGSLGAKKKMALKTDDRMIEEMSDLQTAPIIAPRGTIPPGENNPEISPDVRPKASAIAAKTEARRGQRPLTTPDKEEIPAAGATAAGAGRIMGLLGRMEMMPQKAISSE